MIERIPFGRTGHDSSRVIFGAAALGAMKQDRADRILELLLEHGIDHIDTAASYGESELRVGEWMARQRDHFFLATKTAERNYAGAKSSIEASRRLTSSTNIEISGRIENASPGNNVASAEPARRASVSVRLQRAA